MPTRGEASEMRRVATTERRVKEVKTAQYCASFLAKEQERLKRRAWQTEYQPESTTAKFAGTNLKALYCLRQTKERTTFKASKLSRHKILIAKRQRT